MLADDGTEVLTEMTSAATDTASGPREILQHAHELFLAGRLADFADLFAENGTHELPFAPPGVPALLTGREAIRDYLSAISDTPMKMTSYDTTIYDTSDPEVILIECDATGTVTSSGKPFLMRYIQLLRSRNGEIVTWRDYWSPLQGAEILGGIPETWFPANDPTSN